MALTAGARKPPALTVRTARRWARDNLFGSVANTALTVTTFLFVWFALIAIPGVVEFPPFGIVWFVVDAADWEVITANRKLFFIGRFPADETWRLWVILLPLSGLAGLSWGLWSSIGRRLAAMFVIGVVLIFLFMAEGDVALLTTGTIGLFIGGYVLGRLLAASRYVALARNLAVGGWLLTFPLTMYLLTTGDDVDSLNWGGLLLTMILAIVGIVASFPLALLLALGRASTFPVIRLFCVAYIELIRGVPLITLLFMAKFILPLMVAQEGDVSLLGVKLLEMNDVVRAMAAITIFSSAYLAEIIRGGLQAVPRGQVEAAQALGLGTLRILAFIVLPQALRAVIPALVGQFIALFKDTSLVVIVGLTELLKAAQQVTAQPDFIGRQAEALLFVALIYWIVAFSMSRASQQLERTLGVGER
jgi:general L-amino acid transport system permease protein